MSTHYIAFYEEISKIISIIFKYHEIRTLFCSSGILICIFSFELKAKLKNVFFADFQAGLVGMFFFCSDTVLDKDIPYLSLPVYSGSLKRIDYPKQICLAHPLSFECLHCS